MISENDNLDTFDQWKANLLKRINSWINKLEKDFADKLDFSPDSLQVIGVYLLENFVFESFRSSRDKTIPDAIVSYVGETLRRNLEKSFWDIEVYDTDDLFYNIPVLRYKTQTPISPHSIVTRSLKMENPDFLMKFYRKRKSM